MEKNIMSYDSRELVHKNNEQIVLDKLVDYGFKVFHPSSHRYPDILAKKNGKLVIVEVKALQGSGFYFTPSQLSYLQDISDFLEGTPIVLMLFENKQVRFLLRDRMTDIKAKEKPHHWLHKVDAFMSTTEFEKWHDRFMNGKVVVRKKQ